jgi:hypothetical protein
MVKEHQTLEEMLKGMTLDELLQQLHWARINGADEAWDIISFTIREHRAANKE